MSKKLILVVDAQNDFMRESGALYVPGAQDVIDNINVFLKNLNPEDVDSVLFTFDTHNLEVYTKSEEGKMFPPHCIAGTPGHALAVNISLVPDDIAIFTLHKGVFDMWAEDDVTVYSSDLPEADSREAFFQNLRDVQGITEVTVVGVALNFCVKWAVNGLIERGFKVTVPAVLTKGINTGGGESDLNPALVFEKEIASDRLQVI
jgi:nicotinamidase/pyrazinamidase